MVKKKYFKDIFEKITPENGRLKLQSQFMDLTSESHPSKPFSSMVRVAREVIKGKTYYTVIVGCVFQIVWKFSKAFFSYPSFSPFLLIFPIRFNGHPLCPINPSKMKIFKDSKRLKLKFCIFFLCVAPDSEWYCHGI